MFLKKKDFFADPADEVAADAPDAPEAPAEQPGEPDSAPATPDSADASRAALDLSLRDPQLEEQMRLLEAQARQARRPDVGERVRALRAYLASSRFSVAVVGEFSRGKSTLVNELVGKAVIPTGAIPTTQMPLHVVGDAREAIVVSRKGGEKAYPLSERGWELVGEAFSGAPAAAPREATIRCDCELLRDHDLELVDTPGVNSGMENDLTMADRALVSCDAAILALSATAAFSETEKLFLQEHLLSRKAARVMVVLTMMDLVQEDQRASVVDYARRELDAFGTQIPLFVPMGGLPAEPTASDAPSPVADVRDQLVSWLAESDHAARRRERVLGELRALAEDLSGVYACQLEALREHRAGEDRAVARKKQATMSEAAIEWDALEVELLGRCNENFARIRAMSEERQQDAVEKLLLDLGHTGNPKEWWERDYPYRVKMELVSFGNSLENTLQACYVRDVNWLNHQLGERYKVTVPPQARSIAERLIFKRPVEQGETELEDMRQSRLISRVGTGVLTVGAYLVGGMFGLGLLGIAAGIGGGIVSEVAMGKRVDEQKRTLEKAMREELPGAFDRCVETVEKNVRAIYSQTIADMREACADWAQAKCDAIDAARAAQDPEKQERVVLQRMEALESIGR